ncbi:hypothetical protein BD410DRAFT_811341 [Rickenella mellea]|uniref:MutL C-terminal dimerisation domain-containing protein n=1 Tax=Rickenella mellea TaxID=50990 RepID=A0A4R5XHS1_9AGAM|nr:hypothetical protein BD410DRAFT_811341 [Rickenella mellea]
MTMEPGVDRAYSYPTPRTWSPAVPESVPLSTFNATQQHRRMRRAWYNVFEQGLSEVKPVKRERGSGRQRNATPRCFAALYIVSLDADTRSKLRSTQILTSLPQILSELTQNALDAQAKHIDIGINFEEWSGWVRDDGVGISKDGLDVIGNAGRYATSKAYAPSSLDEISTFGFRGEALASAADISCIEISSRTFRSKECWSIIFKGGEKLYYGPSIRWRRESPGTAVSIRDTFFNLPIRRLSHPNEARTIELVRRDLESFALMFPNVAFSLENTAKEARLGLGKGRVVTIPQTATTLAAFKNMYGRALVEHVEEIHEQHGEIMLDGFISLDGAHSKSYQFLYANKHLLDPCDLHRLIDQKFANSTFAKHAFDETGETRSPRPAFRRSPRKAERKPVFVLNLTVPPRQIDNCLEPAKSSVNFQDREVVATVIGSVCQAFLTRNGFAPSKDAEGTDGSPSPTKRRKVTNLVGGDDSGYFDEPIAGPSTWRKDPLEERFGNRDLYIHGESLAENDEGITWTDPASGRSYRVDPRTGNSYIHTPHTHDCATPRDVESDPHSRSSGRMIVDTRWLKQSRTNADDMDTGNKSREMPEWIQEALKGNEAFAVTEPSIPSVEPSTQEDRRYQKSRHHNCEHSNNGDLEDPSRYLSREDLESIEVVDQIDRKFIACVIHRQDGDHSDGQSGRKLFLVDQHAADERVRVERYLKALCEGYFTRSIQAKVLEPPIPVLLTSHEATRLTEVGEVTDAFERWGFGVLMHESDKGTKEKDGDSGYAQVHFTSVPDVVSSKLLAGDELREVVKGYLARLESDGYPENERLDTFDDEFGWLKALRWCPQELVDLVNSRACRGAIMFNDPLSLTQCQRLISQLAKTALPFQCAHGSSVIA